MLRWALAATLLVACSTDTFVGNDGGDASSEGGDGGTTVDGPIGPQHIVCPTDTNSCDRTTSTCCESIGIDAAAYACTSNEPSACPEGCGATSATTTPIGCDGDDMCGALGGVCCGLDCGHFGWMHCVPNGACNADAGLHRVCAATKSQTCGCGNPIPIPTSPGFLMCP